MNYKEVQDEVIGLRFNVNLRTRVKSWIRLRYGMIWHADEWPFKLASPAYVTLTPTINVILPANMPPGVARVLAIWDDQGAQIPYVEPKVWTSHWQNHQSSGRPVEYTVFDNAASGWQVTFGPVVDQAYQFSMSYERDLYCFAADGTILPTQLTNDTDTPAWNDRFHYMLVTGALSTGLKHVNDPTWQALEDEFLAEINSMREFYLPPLRSENVAYGRDVLV